jgi:hypothetical protein
MPRPPPPRQAALVLPPPAIALAFITALNNADLTTLMGTFSQSNPNTTPRVGITSYGPQFVGFTAVQRLFRQLFITFSRVTLTEQGPIDLANPTANWLFNAAGSPIPQIGIQMNLSGVQVAAWFAAGTPYYSPPLSTIVPDSTRAMDLDVSVIFSFDAANYNKISQVSLYFDRYLMSQQLTHISQA